MSHDTHGTHTTGSERPTSQFRSSVWLVILLALLFISAVNFVNVMGHGESEGKSEHATEGAYTEHASEAGTTKEEAKPAATEAAPVADTAHPEHH